MIFQIKAKVIKNIEVVQKYSKILLSCSKLARTSQPGQFVEIKISDSYVPFLRRPFSIHRIKGPNIEILYEIKGKGTEILSQKRAGEYLDVIGPLGNGFDYTSHATRHTLQVLVAGGIGVAPLLFLAQGLIERKAQSAKRGTLVLIGAKTKDKILCEKEFKDLGCEVKISTDDGSKGFKGKVTDLLEEILVRRHTPHATRHMLHATRFQPAAWNVQRATVIYACGPRLMLKEIASISKQYNILTQVSLEEHMACGIGACLGCVIKIKNLPTKKSGPRQNVGKKSKIKNDFVYQRVCKEGPVFDADDIAWD